MKQTAPHRWNHVHCLPPLCWLLNPPQSNVHCSVCQYWHLHSQAHPIPHRQHTSNIINIKGHPKSQDKMVCGVVHIVHSHHGLCPNQAQAVCVWVTPVRWDGVPTRISKTDSRRQPCPNHGDFFSHSNNSKWCQRFRICMGDQGRILTKHPCVRF